MSNTCLIRNAASKGVIRFLKDDLLKIMNDARKEYNELLEDFDEEHKLKEIKTISEQGWLSVLGGLQSDDVVAQLIDLSNQIFLSETFTTAYKTERGKLKEGSVTDEVREEIAKYFKVLYKVESVDDLKPAQKKEYEEAVEDEVNSRVIPIGADFFEKILAEDEKANKNKEGVATLRDLKTAFLELFKRQYEEDLMHLPEQSSINLSLIHI